MCESDVGSDASAREHIAALGMCREEVVIAVHVAVRSVGAVLLATTGSLSEAIQFATDCSAATATVSITATAACILDKMVSVWRSAVEVVPVLLSMISSSSSPSATLRVSGVPSTAQLLKSHCRFILRGRCCPRVTLLTTTTAAPVGVTGDVCNNANGNGHGRDEADVVVPSESVDGECKGYMGASASDTSADKAIRQLSAVVRRWYGKTTIGSRGGGSSNSTTASDKYYDSGADSDSDDVVAGIRDGSESEGVISVADLIRFLAAPWLEEELLCALRHRAGRARMRSAGLHMVQVLLQTLRCPEAVKGVVMSLRDLQHCVCLCCCSFSRFPSSNSTSNTSTRNISTSTTTTTSTSGYFSN